MKLPVEWEARLAGYAARPTAEGQSSASVFRLTAPDRPPLYLKIEPDGPHAELPGEADRLHWLALSGLPAPRAEGVLQRGRRHWLLLSAVPGASLEATPGLSGEQVLDIVVEALQSLHALDARTCPFDARWPTRIEAARQRLEAGLVDVRDFDEERLGCDADDLFAELLACAPAEEELVVTHGDLTADNIIVQAGHFSGLVDCGRLGVADRHQDLALASRSIRRALGDRWVGRFWARCDPPVDPQRIHFHLLMDEFF